ncbi:hypothetical protein LLEC1_05706 [Akanthomyces lecanii]|uniref:RRM domain-containing protein n=1 Tax=Cordyceps confragosa TaxID=2714763 RepID=A0A179I2K5_CORDF|nr:hypothetical protein LLEC1_05706 [Akanthomyces lecanii]
MSSDEKEMSPVDGAPETNASKRKADVDEIEVDLEAPEPPSKRARRAMKKGKSAKSKSKKDNDNDDLEEDETTDQKDDKAVARSEHGVWIGNLRFSVTPQELRKWLIDNSGGVLTSDMITRLKLPLSKTPGRDKSAAPVNKGFAYVDFSEIGGKVAAIALFKTTEDDVLRNFEKCGEIEWAKVATFEDTGKCKGYGWVKFKDPEAAAWAVKGFVKIKEAIETEDDFRDEDDKGKSDDDDEDEDEDEEQKKKKKNNGQQQKQFKTRKWAETAEDMQTARLTGRVVESTGTKVSFD